ncbi:MAG: M6 family metalloprotease domain-containing protein [Prevotellaceae bacterium]|nr:M6 family metalloprotease domain-containing protein [Prevotellaceae bacterium]
MKKIFCLAVLLMAVCVIASATVKPRRRGAISKEEAAGSSVLAYGKRKAIGERATAPLTAVGSPKIPVILTQFSDVKFTSGLTSEDGGTKQCLTDEDVVAVNAFFDKFCNGEGEENGYYKGGGSYGAIKEYFRDQSGGKFTPEFVVIGPVTLDKECAFYGKNNGSAKDVNISYFYKEAIERAQKIITDWSAFDNDGNGSIDMAFFIYAGEGENGHGSDDTIWPKEQTMGGTINGVKYGCYACCNETMGGKTDGIGVFVHELSHALGLPDFYDTRYIAYGMDYWDIMDSGCYCNNAFTPCNYTAYERDFMGWSKLVTLNPDEPQVLTLNPLSDNGIGYKIVNPMNEDEFYVIENRQPLTWDLYVGNGTERTKMHGLMVTHVDYQHSSWTSNTVNTNATHQRMTIIPADGDLYSYMDVENQEQYNQYMLSTIGDLFPGAKNVTELSGEQAYVYTSIDEATPHQMNQAITDITENDDMTITLRYMGGPSSVTSSLFANREENVPVYGISGVLVGVTDIEYGKPTNLPAASGVYIVGGKKYIVK